MQCPPPGHVFFTRHALNKPMNGRALESKRRKRRNLPPTRPAMLIFSLTAERAPCMQGSGFAHPVRTAGVPGAMGFRSQTRQAVSKRPLDAHDPSAQFFRFIHYGDTILFRPSRIPRSLLRCSRERRSAKAPRPSTQTGCHRSQHRGASPSGSSTQDFHTCRRGHHCRSTASPRPSAQKCRGGCHRRRNR